ncbi:MAG: response regulator transcription factor [Chloroflexi bacterium]|nr:response regulator transcription factor [Chloroflexota bacterium]
MIRILLCDDQEIVTEGLHLILETDPELRIVGAASNGAQAVEMAAVLQPDLVLMDLKMPGMNGVRATRAIRRAQPAEAVLVLTTFDDDSWVLDAIRSGASGYLLKDTSRDRLIEAIKDTVAGKTHVDPQVAGKLLQQIAQRDPAPEPLALVEPLTKREVDVLRLMTEGLSYMEIAGRLFLSEGTVRNYASSIFAKMGVADRMQAVVTALREGVVLSLKPEARNSK